MNKLTARLLYKGGNIERQNVLWNTAGSFCYALASMVLSFLVIRMIGEDQGGIFSFFLCLSLCWYFPQASPSQSQQAWPEQEGGDPATEIRVATVSGTGWRSW